MCDKAINDYTSAIQLIPNGCITQEIYNKTVNVCTFVFYSFPDQFKTREMCCRVVSEKHFMLKCYPDILKNQKTCDKAADFYLIILNYVPRWFVTNKMLEILDNSVIF